MYWACIFPVQKSRIRTGPGKKFPVRSGHTGYFYNIQYGTPFFQNFDDFHYPPAMVLDKLYSIWIFPGTGPVRVSSTDARAVPVYFQNLFQKPARIRSGYVHRLILEIWKYIASNFLFFSCIFKVDFTIYIWKNTGWVRVLDSPLNFHLDFTCIFFPVWMRPSYWKFKLEISRQLFRYTNAYSLSIYSSTNINGWKIKMAWNIYNIYKPDCNRVQL